MKSAIAELLNTKISSKKCNYLNNIDKEVREMAGRY